MRPDEAAAVLRARPGRRPEIDGLRALAVLAVMGFHAGWPGFGGGYVGVDVFFVLSGYLITGLILDELADGRFSLAVFVERRARRIAPALLLVLLASTLAGAWLMTPRDLVAQAQAVLAALGLVPNIYFWRTADYFQPAAEFVPLLHTWSLGVEEQFYLLFPLALLAFWKLAPRRLLPVFALATLASFGLATWAVETYRGAAFYLLPTRAWELLLGGVAALVERPPRRGPTASSAAPGAAAAAATSTVSATATATAWAAALARTSTTALPSAARPPAAARSALDLLATAGLAAILLAVLAYDRQRAFPGPAALLPTLGTALVLLAARPGGWVARGLALRPLVALGLVSYGAYLWHQPILALQRYASEAPPSVAARAGALLLALVCAAASWRLLEAPVRRAQGRDPRRFWLGLLAAAVLVGGLAAGLLRSGGWPGRWSEPQRQVLGLGERPYAEAYREGRCFLRADQPPAAHAATCPDAAVDGGLAVWGDSHAAALAAGLRGPAGAVPLRQYTASGCPPLAEAVAGLPPHCRAFSHAVGEALRRQPPARLLLHARWSDHAGTVDEAAQQAALRALHAALPGTRILLLGPVPRWYPGLPLHLARGPQPWTGAVAGPDAGAAADAPLEQRLADRAAAAGVDYRSLRALACPAGACRQVVGAPGREAPLVWDEAHLTPEGAAWLAEALVPTLP